MHIDLLAFMYCQYRTAEGSFRDWAVEGQVKFGVGECEVMHARRTSPGFAIK